MDQATGEIGGSVLPSGLKQPLVAQRGQVRQLALAEHLLRQAVVEAVEPEDDHPLEPGCVPAPAGRSSDRHSSRTGQVSNISSAEQNAANTAKNEPARANPAPGPM